MRFHVGCFAALAIVTASSAAYAGIISTENAKPGISGGWTARNDGTARFDGVVDLYPAHWSISPGDTLGLKVRSTTSFDVRVFRLGWYGGAGATQVKVVAGQAANPQPYPTTDSKYGLAEAKWTTNVTITDTAGWTPGLYVARAEQPSGKEAITFFAVRDDKLPTKLPILLVVGTATHQAYNAWPGPARGGKSLYGFNSSSTHPSESIGTLTQAVRVSFDRPFFVGGGTADVSVYEYPYLRWLEKNGYDVAIATDVDLHSNPSIAAGRKVITFSGHEEYVTWQMFDNAIAARDAGTNFLFLSGDTWSWQVRLEGGSAGGTSTLIGYKESWVKDPEQKTAYSLKTAGKIEEAKSHYRLVTRGWKNLEYDPASGIDERRPGMTLTGVQSSGIIRDKDGVGMHGGLYPWADLVVTTPSFWIYAGTGVTGGAKIPHVFGYEVDSTLASSPEFDKWRKPGQVVFGKIAQTSDGAIKGSSAYYRTSGGAEVVAMSAIYTSWALDDWGWKSGGFETAGKPNPLSTTYQKMISNALERWSGTTPPPPFDAGVSDAGDYDAGSDPVDADPVEKDVGVIIPDTELVDVFEVGVADTFVPPDTTAPPADTGITPGDDATVVVDTAVADDATTAPTDATTGDAGSSTPDAAGPVDTGTSPPVAAEGGTCTCTTPGTSGRTGEGALSALALLGLVAGVASRRRARV